MTHLIIRGAAIETVALKEIAKAAGANGIEQVRPNVFRLERGKARGRHRPVLCAARPRLDIRGRRPGLMPGSADHSGVRDGTDAGTVSNTLSSRLRHFLESVMHLIRPFAGLRPAPGRAAEVIAPPYDVLSSEEARKQAAGKPWSFLHISKPEIRAFAGGNEPLRARGLRQGSRKPEPDDARRRARTRRCALLLRLPPRHGRPYANPAWSQPRRWRSTTRTASAGTNTRSRTRRTTAYSQIDALNAQTGPVMVAYPPAKEVDDILARCSAGTPDADVVADPAASATRYGSCATARRRRRRAETFDAMPAHLHRRRPSSLGRRFARGVRAARGQPAPRWPRNLQLLPDGDLPAPPDADPGL